MTIMRFLFLKVVMNWIQTIISKNHPLKKWILLSMVTYYGFIFGLARSTLHPTPLIPTAPTIANAAIPNPI